MDELKNEETAFSSPMPMLRFVKQLVFGEDDPQLMQKIMIYLNLTVWLVFFLWHTLSYFAIAYRDIIQSEKKINVEILILNRGSDLGYDPSLFLSNLLSFHRIGILCWLLIFVSAVFMWRKKMFFAYLLFGSLIMYYGAMLYFVGIPYYMEDTTLFDKITVAIMILNSIFFLITLKTQDSDGERFFGLQQDD